MLAVRATYLYLLLNGICFVAPAAITISEPTTSHSVPPADQLDAPEAYAAYILTVKSSPPPAPSALYTNHEPALPFKVCFSIRTAAVEVTVPVVVV